jgi:xanthine dehydrogenase accessory factor
MAEAFAEIVQAVLDALAGGEAVVTATVVTAPEGAGVHVGDKLAVRRDGRTIGRLDGGAIEAAVRDLAQAAFTEHSAGSVYLLADGRQVRRSDPEFRAAAQILIETVEAPATLLVVGAGHIGRSLAKIGAEVGFSVAVLDDRPDYASPELIPEADQVICDDFEAALARFPITENTYIVMVTRGHKQDELSLRATVRSRAAYIGMISRRRASLRTPSTVSTRRSASTSAPRRRRRSPSASSPKSSWSAAAAAAGPCTTAANPRQPNQPRAAERTPACPKRSPASIITLRAMRNATVLPSLAPEGMRNG